MPFARTHLNPALGWFHFFTLVAQLQWVNWLFTANVDSVFYEAHLFLGLTIFSSTRLSICTCMMLSRFLTIARLTMAAQRLRSISVSTRIITTPVA